MKTLIHILGPGASGKSTLTRAVCGEGGLEYTTTLTVQTRRGEEQERVRYSLFPNGCAIAGNIKNGSDSISSMDALKQVVDLCLAKSDVHMVVVDPVRSSNKFVDWIQQKDLRAVFVYLDLSLEENLRRLKKRRESNGKSVDLSEKTLSNVADFRARAAGVWNYAKEHYTKSPNFFVTIPESSTPETAAGALRRLL